MKRVWLMLMVMGLACLVTQADYFPLWPKGEYPFAVTNLPPENVKPLFDTSMRFINVSESGILACPVAGTNLTAAVIICPGGGYHHLAWVHEGDEIAEWLLKQGIAAFILKYRVPNQEEGAFADGQRAVSWVRYNAAKFHVDPTRIGMIGFSAGSHLTAKVSTRFAQRCYPARDAIDAVSCRPDFTMLLYPWRLVTDDPSAKEVPLSLLPTFPISAATPPAFIIQSEDDFAHVENALAYFAALKKAGVPCEMHLFPKGGHGYALRKKGNPTDVWPILAEAWLRGQ